MLKITRDGNGEVVFRVSGRMDSENIAELKRILSVEKKARRVTLDLSELTLVDEGAVCFLGDCEANGIKLKSCPAYVREWITRNRGDT
jgi:anti-anti-sigma regulatory factor